MVMKVLVITGSPHGKVTSALMAEKFIEGASEMGAQINRFDAAFANVHPCIGCDVCHCGENKSCGCFGTAFERWNKLFTLSVY